MRKTDQEFLHFLTFKKAQASEQDNQELLNGYMLAQKDFLLVQFINAEFALVSAKTKEKQESRVEE